MLEFATPANTTEALAIIRAMSEGVTVANPGGSSYRPAAVLAIIGTGFLFYTSAYCAAAQQRDGLWTSHDFTKGTPYWLEDIRTGKLVPINGMATGAAQLLAAITDASTPREAYNASMHADLDDDDAALGFDVGGTED